MTSRIATDISQVMPESEALRPLHKIPAAVPGFSDFSPSEQILFDKMKGIVEKTFKLHGFNPFDVPPFVHRKFLVSKGGIDAQIFSVNRIGTNDMTPNGLAFDRTVPMALWVRDHRKELSFPYYRYDISLSYRAENPSTGRLNGFYQADVDIIGPNLPLTCEVECITTIAKALLSLQIPKFNVFINHIEIPKQLIDQFGFKRREKVLSLIDNLDKTPKDEIARQIKELEPDVPREKIDELVEICCFRGDIKDFKYLDALPKAAQDRLADIKFVLEYVEKNNIDGAILKFAPGIVRGLDYYTGIVCETFMEKYPKFGSVASGGRYDGLVDAFTSKPTGINGMGASIGLSRIFHILLAKKEIASSIKTSAKVIVLMRNRSLYSDAISIASTLRERELSTVMYSGPSGKLASQLKYANAIGSRIAVIVMDKNKFTIRDLEKSTQSPDIRGVERTVDAVREFFIKSEEHESLSYRSRSSIKEIGRSTVLSLDDFQDIVFGGANVKLASDSAQRLNDTREFVSHLLDSGIKVYGLNTGFADLREKSVSAADAGKLSENIILSHDAGIGDPLSDEVVLGAMVSRANSLSKGYSAIQKDTLETLIAMINERIIPIIPKTGSLGASGDLALLARLGRAMEGHDVAVRYKGEVVSAKIALERAGIKPFIPAAKEGLALTNGTSFMSSMLSIAYLRQLNVYENMVAAIAMYLAATRSVDAAFSSSIQEVRSQSGQEYVAKIFRDLLANSPFIDRSGVQDDYSQRCIPQIFGPKFDVFMSIQGMVTRELDSVTDNPLLFRNDEISPDISDGRVIKFKNDEWAVLSGGNFHGEVIATAADSLREANVKIALTMERHLTFLCNPARNKGQLPPYLIVGKEAAGLRSGFMIPQYAANGLAQKISNLAHPVSNFNLTSANESEDIVSYGLTSAELLLEQLKLMEQLSSIYLTMVTQAYSLTRDTIKGELNDDLTTEKLFSTIISNINPRLNTFPINEEVSFTDYYTQMQKLLDSRSLREIIGFPLARKMKIDLPVRGNLGKQKENI